MIDWIDGAGRAWGIQRRRILMGGVWHADGFHFDGYPARSVLAKLREERDGASHATVRSQHYPEVMRGDALAFRRALEGAPAWAVDVAAIRYVVPKAGMPTKRKAQELRAHYPEINSSQRYYEALDRLHVLLLGRWPVECLPDTERARFRAEESVRTK